MKKIKVKRKLFRFGTGKYELIVEQNGSKPGSIHVVEATMPRSKAIRKRNGREVDLRPLVLCDARIVDGRWSLHEDDQAKVFALEFLAFVEKLAKPLIPPPTEREERMASLAKALAERDEARKERDAVREDLLSAQSRLKWSETLRRDHKDYQKENLALREHLRAAVLEILRSADRATEAYIAGREGLDGSKHLLEIRESAKKTLSPEMLAAAEPPSPISWAQMANIGVAALTMLGAFAMAGMAKKTGPAPAEGESK